MENHEKDSSDTETVLMALDQISQTIDVMNSVVGRLRTHVQQQALAVTQDELPAEIYGNRVLH
ncbi:MAG TPA: hypothetical protein VIC02_06885 [Kineobactrum sp.]